MSELSVSDSSTRHLAIMKDFAQDYSTIIPPIAIDDLRDDYKDAIQLCGDIIYNFIILLYAFVFHLP